MPFLMYSHKNSFFHFPNSPRCNVKSIRSFSLVLLLFVLLWLNFLFFFLKGIKTKDHFRQGKNNTRQKETFCFKEKKKEKRFPQFFQAFCFLVSNMLQNFFSPFDVFFSSFVSSFIFLSFFEIFYYLLKSILWRECWNNNNRECSFFIHIELLYGKITDSFWFVVM